jgi:hypothetical protein
MTQTPDITPEAVERIATDLMGFDAAYKMPTCSTAAHTLASLSARLAEVEAADDGRPMVTDLFLVKLLESNLDDFDRVASIRDWVEGDWDAAMEGIEG